MTNVNFNRKPSFRIIPEGVQTLKITKVSGIPRAAVTSVTVSFATEDGITQDMKYDLTNQYSYNAFYYLVSNGCGFDLDGDFDIDNMVGKYVEVEIRHRDGARPREDGTFPVFANIKRTIGAGTPFGGEATTTEADTDDWDEE